MSNIYYSSCELHYFIGIKGKNHVVGIVKLTACHFYLRLITPRSARICTQNWGAENGSKWFPHCNYSCVIHYWLPSELTTIAYFHLSLRPEVLYTILPEQQTLFSTQTRHIKLHTQCNTHNDNTETAPKHSTKRHRQGGSGYRQLCVALCWPPPAACRAPMTFWSLDSHLVSQSQQISRNDITMTHTEQQNTR